MKSTSSRGAPVCCCHGSRHMCPGSWSVSPCRPTMRHPQGSAQTLPQQVHSEGVFELAQRLHGEAGQMAPLFSPEDVRNERRLVLVGGTGAVT